MIRLSVPTFHLIFLLLFYRFSLDPSPILRSFPKTIILLSRSFCPTGTKMRWHGSYRSVCKDFLFLFLLVWGKNFDALAIQVTGFGKFWVLGDLTQRRILIFGKFDQTSHILFGRPFNTYRDCRFGHSPPMSLHIDNSLTGKNMPTLLFLSHTFPTLIKLISLRVKKFMSQRFWDQVMLRTVEDRILCCGLRMERPRNV